MDNESMGRFSSAPAWVRFRVLQDLEERPSDDPDVLAALRETLDDERVRILLADVAAWPGTILNSHRSASQTFHTLEFLSELGLPSTTAEIAVAVERILGGIKINPEGETDGIPRLPMRYPEHFGGPGVELSVWALCDAPTLLLALLRFGRAADPRVAAGIASLMRLVRGNGWPCAVAPELGTFRGPGKKSDPCPYATLIMLRLIASTAAADKKYLPLLSDQAAADGTECLLRLWDHSRDEHPYLFYMGNDFRKLKAPFLWYDLLHVAEVLSLFPAVRADRRFQDMLGLIKAKAGPDGGYTAESVYAPYKAWDFGQKKSSSSWLEFLVARIEKRLAEG